MRLVNKKINWEYANFLRIKEKRIKVLLIHDKTLTSHENAYLHSVRLAVAGGDLL